MSKDLLAEVFSVAFNDSKKSTVFEAKMNDIPHEIDDVVHKLKDIRFDMEELKKTWEMANMDLAPLDSILEGINSLIKSVYNNGAVLADQNIGSINRESSLKEEDKLEDDPNNSDQDENTDSVDDEDGWKEIKLIDVLNLLKHTENELLERAFKRGVRLVRNKKSDDAIGEIQKVFISPEGNLKIMFKDVNVALYAYVDGGIATQEQ